MKLESKLYKFELQKVTELSKVIGGAVQETYYQSETGCGHDKMDTQTNNGCTYTNSEGKTESCDFATYSQLASTSYDDSWTKK
jgi:hypothetical protein